MKISKKLTTVTTFSKILAIIMFVTFPLAGFYLGMEYQKGIAIPEVLLEQNKPTGDNQKTTIANPASVYCKEQGGKLKIQEDSTGGELGICTFSDGTSCEEWAFYRKECDKK
jgi:putative hemolysin